MNKFGQEIYECLVDYDYDLLLSVLDDMVEAPETEAQKRCTRVIRWMQRKGRPIIEVLAKLEDKGKEDIVHQALRDMYLSDRFIRDQIDEVLDRKAMAEEDRSAVVPYVYDQRREYQ